MLNGSEMERDSGNYTGDGIYTDGNRNCSFLMPSGVSVGTSIASPINYT